MEAENGGTTLKVVIVRDRESAGGGIFNYYQAINGYLSVERAFVDVGRPRSYYSSGKKRRAAKVPTPLRLVLEWVNLFVKLLGFPEIVHLNPGLDIKSRRSLRRDAVSLVMAKLFRRKVIVFWRGWDNDACGSAEFPGGNAGWVSRAYRRADAHVVLASEFRDDLFRWGVQGRKYLETTVVSDYILEGTRDCPPQVESTPFRVLFLSRVEVEKGVFEMLDALAILNERSPGRFHLTVAGDGAALQDLKQYAATLGLTNIEFTGYTIGHDKISCYSRASAFCFLSYTEGMPNAVLEAMAAGLPLVSSTAGGLKDILEDGVNGYIVTYNRTQAPRKRFCPLQVADRFERLAASPSFAHQISLTNRSHARHRFAPACVAERLQNIYQEIASTSE